MKEELNKAGVCILTSVWLCGCASHAASPSSLQADKVVVAKGQRVLVLMSKENVLKTYHVALGKQPKGPKMREGDGKTPEGHYVIDRRNAKSRFHLALHISYPSVADVQNARKLGVSPGGDIMIHGLPSGWGWMGALHTKWDWTDGCIAVTNAEIEEIWRAVPNGTPIEIRP
ncbi:MAG: hypothetical protein DMG25_13380 [Acidobacteria bacterium]|nr:MAG: hypothetical protein DMG25_13380 [Acidobacteriota bacterium]